MSEPERELMQAALDTWNRLSDAEYAELVDRSFAEAAAAEGQPDPIDGYALHARPGSPPPNDLG
ncbi:hypothetical protein [Geodermatophilus sp. SYSU D01176]